MRLDESKITKDRQIYTKARVDSELNLIMEELDDLDLDWPQVPEKRSKAKTSDLVAALVTARKTLRSYDAENWEENTFEILPRSLKKNCYCHFIHLMEMPKFLPLQLK